MNLVYAMPDAGALYQGDIDDAKAALAGIATPKIDAVVLCAMEAQPANPRKLSGARVWLDDSIPASQSEAQDVIRRAKKASDFVVRWVQLKKAVLVTCYAGRNRSGLVTGLALKSFGFTGPEAVKAIRKARGPIALSNTFFAEVVAS